LDAQRSDPPWTKSLVLFTLRKLGLRANAQQSLVKELLAAQVQQTSTDKNINDIDGSLRGWSWVDGTFSWVEPTSYALMALKSTGLLVHPRVQEAERLLLDRTCSDGGWNYGNRLVRGATLGSMSSTTAVATIALQRATGADKVVKRALELLDREVQANPSGLALALTVLCFSAFEREAGHLRDRLAERQTADGSWRGQPHLTALAVLALRTGDQGNAFKI
jgi:hypothetical protein